MRKNTLLILLLLLTLFIGGCTDPETPDNKYTDYLKNLEIAAEFSENFTLPETINDLPITWESKNPDILSVEGFSYIQTEDKKAVLTATITVDGKDYTKDFEVLVKADTEGLFDLAWEYYAPKLDTTTVKDIKLFTRKYGQFTVAYKSLNEDIITSEGIITQSNEDQTATFEITIMKGNERKVYTKDVKVLKYTDIQRSEIVVEWVREQVALFQEGLVKELPTKHPELGTTISWSSDIPGTISPEGVLLKPVEIVDCTFTYEVKSGDYTTRDKFTVESFGGSTEKEYLDAWLETIMPTKIIGHKNTLHKEGNSDELFLDKQYAVNTGAVLNLINGKDLTINKKYFVDVANEKNLVAHWDGPTHPAISTDPNSTNLQAVYAHFYEGYTIPNEENILWIVVHESGMPLAGQNAELLAKIQYNRAHGLSAYSPASWHYQVDETGIYQSFDDNVYCWHAGGDYGKWLPYRNQNSIGIEMCINQDGNYDGSMAHDAKLVASLMHKYNLTLDNVVRHHDTSGKECPSYMIRTNRYNEFLQMVTKEYIAIKYLKDAEVTWTISNPELFEQGPNGLYYSKQVKQATDVTISLKVVKGSYVFESTSTITLKPDGAK